MIPWEYNLSKGSTTETFNKLQMTLYVLRSNFNLIVSLRVGEQFFFLLTSTI